MYHVYILYKLFPERFWLSIAQVFFLLCCGIVLFTVLYKKKKLSRRKKNIAIIWWIYLLIILYFTLIGRFNSVYYKVIPVPFDSYRLVFSGGGFSELSQIVLNILLFVPFGALTAELIKDRFPLWTVLIAGMVLTAMIEFTQLINRLGTFETDDLIHNTLGTVIGILMWYGIKGLIKRREKSKSIKKEELSE